MLKKMFKFHSTLVEVTLNQPKVKGLPTTIKERREACSMMQIHLPHYTILTVNLLLDLLYTGKTKQCGEIDQSSGQLYLVVLYSDLGIEADGGGLPDIAELETIELEWVKKVVEIEVHEEVQQVEEKEEIKQIKKLIPLSAIEVVTSTTIDAEADLINI